MSLFGDSSGNIDIRKCLRKTDIVNQYFMAKTYTLNKHNATATIISQL